MRSPRISMPATAVRTRAVFRNVTSAGRFLAELAAMCVVMCAGGGMLVFVVFQAAGALGYPDLVQRSPYVSVVAVTLCLAAAMTVYMAVRGHARRHTVEMTAATVGVGAVMIGLLWSEVIAVSGLLTWHDVFGLVCGPACLVMVVQMLIGFGGSGQGRIST